VKELKKIFINNLDNEFNKKKHSILCVNIVNKKITIKFFMKILILKIIITYFSFIREGINNYKSVNNQFNIQNNFKFRI
jgi:hypothetical protein